MASNNHLSLDSLLRIVRGEEQLPHFDYSAMTRAHEFAIDIVSTMPVYGRSTGVGANKSTALAETNSVDQDLRLLRSHATGAGHLMDAETVRIALIIRLNQLLRGGSGISADAALGLRSLVEDDATPQIHEVGGLGTGDLSQMAELALTLIGERETRDGRSEVRWSPHGGDALPFISSNAFTVASAVRIYEELGRYIDHYSHVAAASLYVSRSNLEPLAPEVQAARPHHNHDAATTRIVNAIGDMTWEPKRLQDTFGFRALGPVLSTLLTARDRLASAVETELNASPENPLVDVSSGRVFHNGNFHTQQLMVEIESTALALYGAAQLSFNRTTRLSESDVTGMSPFLSDSTPGSSGIMMVEYVSASALNRLRVHAQPASLTNVTVSRGSEDHAPFTAQAAEQLLAGLSEARRILAVELLGAGRGATFLATDPGHRSAPFLDYLNCAPLNTSIIDRPLSDDIDALEQFVTANIETLNLRK